MKLSDIQIIRWPRGYRRKMRKAAEAEGLSVSQWLVKKVSGELEAFAHAEIVGNVSGTPPVNTSDSSEERQVIRSIRLAEKFKTLQEWILGGRSVIREPADQYPERSQSVQVTIPLQGGRTRRLSAIAKFQGRARRSIIVEFQDESLPPGKEIDTGKQCLVTFKLNGQPQYMPASIESISDGKGLFLKDKGIVPVPLERRRALRIKANFPLEYKRQIQHGFRQAQGIDINTKGIQLRCQEGLEAGEILVLNIKLPLPEPYIVLCRARVIWSRKLSDTIHATGCQFLDLTEQDRDALEDFCLREVLYHKRS